MPEQLASSALRVDFTVMPWQQVRPGVRHKVYREGSRQLRLVEFDTSDGVADWCQVGHVGYVLAGGLNIDVNGSILQFAAGDGLFIPPGSVTQHRPVTIEPGTRLLMVEDLDMEEG
jgi:mannose-6-phosphate isomerase-like protein (cupin superfamily)